MGAGGVSRRGNSLWLIVLMPLMAVRFLRGGLNAGNQGG
jgi:hypothetical protein